MKLTPILLALALASSACSSTHEHAITPDSYFDISFVILEAPDRVVNEWLDKGSTSYVVTTSTSADELLAAAKREGKVELQPSVRVRDAATGHVSVNVRTLEYVKDVTAHWEPIQGKIESGLFIDMTPDERGDGSVDIAITMRESILVEPIREHKVTPDGSKEPVTIQLPECLSFSVGITPNLTANQVALIPMVIHSSTAAPSAPPNVRRVAILRVRPSM